MSVRVAINGFGRIGRAVFRIIAERPDAGIEVVIDLRVAGERDWDEASVAETLGLAYHNVPIPGQEPFDVATFDEIETLLLEHPSSKILVHCSSGNRAAAWITTHLVRQHGLSSADAVAIGRRAGMTKPAIVTKTKTFLELSSAERS